MGSPTISLEGLQVPVLLIAWLLPLAGAGLTFLALSLQLTQTWMLQLKAGEVLAVFAILSVVAGYYCLLKVESERDTQAQSSPPPKARRASRGFSSTSLI